jgi:hypothetical protein
MIGAVLLMWLVSASWPGSPGVRCQTYAEPTLQRQQTICSDGTRGVSTWNPTLQRWDSVVTPPARTWPEHQQHPAPQKKTK